MDRDDREPLRIIPIEARRLRSDEGEGWATWRRTFRLGELVLTLAVAPDRLELILEVASTPRRAG